MPVAAKSRESLCSLRVRSAVLRAIFEELLEGHPKNGHHSYSGIYVRTWTIAIPIWWLEINQSPERELDKNCSFCDEMNIGKNPSCTGQIKSSRGYLQKWVQYESSTICQDSLRAADKRRRIYFVTREDDALASCSTISPRWIPMNLRWMLPGRALILAIHSLSPSSSKSSVIEIAALRNEFNWFWYLFKSGWLPAPAPAIYWRGPPLSLPVRRSAPREDRQSSSFN